jgi:hypothetical protein
MPGVGTNLVSGKPRNAKMSAKVQEIEGTQVPRDSDEVQIPCTGQQHHHTDDIGAAEIDPEVSSAGGGIRRMRLGGDEVLPTGDTVLFAHCVKTRGIVHSRSGKAITVNRDTVQFGDRVGHILLAAIEDAARHLQHGAVEGEVGMKRGGVAEFFDPTWHPVEWLLGESEGHRAGEGAYDGCETEKTLHTVDEGNPQLGEQFLYAENKYEKNVNLFVLRKSAKSAGTSAPRLARLPPGLLHRHVSNQR